MQPTDNIRAKLKNIPLFKKLSERPDALDWVIGVLEPKNVLKGQTIIAEGETGEEMYVLIKGEIEISRFTLEKESYTVAKLTDQMNIFFGELALVDNDRRSATVAALSDCELLVLTRTKFRELGEKHSDIGWNLALEIAGMISGRLRKANEDALILFEALLNELKE